MFIFVLVRMFGLDLFAITRFGLAVMPVREKTLHISRRGTVQELLVTHHIPALLQGKVMIR